jgi:hypothetical protein
MGNNTSAAAYYDPAHVRIYTNILKLETPYTRVKMIEAVLSNTECLHSAISSGLYGHLVGYVNAVNTRSAPPLLPGERATHMPVATPTPTPTHAPTPIDRPQPSSQITTFTGGAADPWKQVAKKPQEKAISFFNSCLEVLGLKENELLTDDKLKAAYKRAAVKAHPDKGGSEEEFKTITKAYAYLNEILKRVQGVTGPVQAGQAQAPQAPQKIATERAVEEERWKHVEPVHLNPKNLNINAFNQLYEQTRLPDPDDDGYGDWLKNEEAAASATASHTFSGKFNRDVFNSVFDADQRQKASMQVSVVHPKSMALTIAPTAGVEIGREKVDDYTAPANADLQYTDLKKAYTTEATFTNKLAGIHVENRDIKSYQAKRDAAPVLTEEEKAQIQEEEDRFNAIEKQRGMRLNQQRNQEEMFFERMKMLAITNQ